MRIFLLFILVFGLSSCVNSEGDNVYEQSGFDEFVSLQCDARKLKSERFTLAEKLRKGENVVSNPDSLRNALASQSRDLAENLRERLVDLTAEMSLDEKRVFNDSLEAAIAKLDCN